MSESKSHSPAENKMGYMPVNRLLLSMSLPMMVAMLIQALYNVVDSVFVSRLGEDALTALSLAFPVQNLMIAIASGTGVGVNALLSRSLGEKNTDQANKAAVNGVFLAVLSYLAFLLFGILGVRAFFLSQTDIPSIVEQGYAYLSICCIGSLGIFGEIMFERLLQSTGKTFYTLITQGVGAILNIVLDPILIFGMFGLPRMGVAGAALATILGQLVAMLLGLYFNLVKNTSISLSLSGFRPHLNTIKRIYAVGLPSIIMVSISSVMTFGMNKILMAFTSTATAVFGVYFKLQSFVFMPVFGLNNGMVPIIAFNYGARKRDRMVNTIKLSVTYAVAIMLVGFAIFQLAPGLLLSLFDASPEMMAIGIPALRGISYSFLFAGFCIVVGSVFQALGRGMLSLLVSVARQLLVLLPAAYLLSLSGNLNLVWFAFPIAEVASVVLSAVFMARIYRQVIRPLDASQG